MTLYLIIVMGILGQLGFSGSRVAVSLLALELGANQVTVGVVIALYALCPLLLSIVIGKYIDRTGLLLPFIVGLAGIVIGLALPALVPSIVVLCVSGLLLGLAHQFFLIPIEASVGGIGGPQKRATNYALLTMGWSVANFFGPLIAGFSIDYLGYVQAYWVLVSFSALALLIVAFRPGLFPAPAKHTAKGGHGGVLELWRIAPLRTIFITGAVINAGHNLFQFYFPIYGHSLGLSASAIGTILGVVSAAAFVIRGVVPLLMKKRTEAEILTYAVFVGAFAFALLPFVANPYALAAIAFVLGLGVGCANPLSMSLLYVLTPPGRVGESLGLLKTVYNFSKVVIPLVFGSVGAAFGFSTVFLSNATMLGASGWLMRRTRLPVDDRPK